MNENKEIPSPFIEAPEFDYDKYRDDTMVKAVTDILKLVGENAEALSYTSKSTQEEIEEVENNISMQVAEILVKNKVANIDMQILMDTFPVIFHRIFQKFSRMKSEYEKELLARVMNSRNPGDGHYSREYSTIGDMFTALEKIRVEQKDDPKGYFYTAKRPE